MSWGWGGSGGGGVTQNVVNVNWALEMISCGSLNEIGFFVFPALWVNACLDTLGINETHVDVDLDRSGLYLAEAL